MSQLLIKMKNQNFLPQKRTTNGKGTKIKKKTDLLLSSYSKSLTGIFESGNYVRKKDSKGKEHIQ